MLHIVTECMDLASGSEEGGGGGSQEDRHPFPNFMSTKCLRSDTIKELPSIDSKSKRKLLRQLTTIILIFHYFIFVPAHSAQWVVASLSAK